MIENTKIEEMDNESQEMFARVSAAMKSCSGSKTSAEKKEEENSRGISNEREVVRTVMSEDKETEEDESNNDEYDSTSSEEEIMIPRRVIKKEIPRTKEKFSNLNDEHIPNDILMKTLIEKMDTRKVPKPEPYNEEKDRDLKKYIERFEMYCEMSFKGDSTTWMDELERNLTGKMLEGVRSLRRPNDNYEELKKKLLDWYKDDGEIRKSYAINQFNNAKMKPNESLYLYSSRLMRAFELAHPRRSTDESRKLLNKYISSVDENTRKIIETLIINAKMNGKKLKYEDIQRFARIQDAEKEKKKINTQGRSEIKINIGQTSNANYRNNRDMNFNDRQIERCQICRKRGHVEENCWMANVTCYSCRNVGHIARNCPNEEENWRFQQQNINMNWNRNETNQTTQQRNNNIRKAEIENETQTDTLNW